MKHIKLLLIVFFIGNIGFAQTTIYTETFTSQNGKGAVGPVPIINTSGVTWNIDVSLATLDDSNDYLQVVNDALEGRDLDGASIWYSPMLNISNFTNVQFSLDASETGNHEAADTFDTEYRIDGGPWSTATTNGNLSDDFTNAVVTEIGLGGNTLELRVIMNNNGGGERLILDNVLVEGTAPVTTLIVVNPNTISGVGYVEGDASTTEQAFTVQGFFLTTDIIINAPANFEISTTSGAGFGNTVNLTPIAGAVTLTTIYTRLISGLTVNTYNGVITANSTGATTQNIAISGEVTTPIADCSQLMISEYHESAGGTPNEKYIELYNPTNTTIDLSNYRLASYRNGNTIPNFIDLSGMINPYGTFLISRDNSTLCVSGVADLCTTSNVMNFNGNDIMALQTIGGLNIDVIGIIGSTTNFAQNVVLRRNASVQIPTIAYDSLQWTSAPSNDTSNLASHFSICECPNITTWDGTSWDNGVPNITTAAIINGNYNMANGGLEVSFLACSLIINSGNTLTISDGNYAEISHNVINSGNLNITTAGSFVQQGVGSAAGSFINSGAGSSSVTKSTSTFDSTTGSVFYTYWSSPVTNAGNLETVFPNAIGNRRYSYNAANFIDSQIETGNDNSTTNPGQDDIDDNGDDWEFANGNPMDVGRGYAVTAAFPPPMPGNFSDISTFNGAFNTGDITITISKNDNEINDNNWNFIGNPYPSAISAQEFLTLNANIDNDPTAVGGMGGALFFWSQISDSNAGNNGNENENFSQNDYAIMNGVSGIAGGATTSPPSPYIPSGQGFFVSFEENLAVSANTVSTVDVIFTNAMRETGNNTQFFEVNDSQNNADDSQNSVDNKNTLWLNLTSDNGTFSQVSIAYVNEATNDYDGWYFDTPRNFSIKPFSSIYTLIDNVEKKFAIQGRNLQTLNTDEVVSVGFYSRINAATIYSFSLDDFEGDFLTDNPIYIKDNLTNIIHDLKASDYNFTSETGEFNERFEIVFNQDALSLGENELDANALTIIEHNDGKVEFKISNLHQIENIEIVDILGKVVYDFKVQDGEHTIYNLDALSQSTYIARVTLSDGQVITQKAIKRK